MTALDIAVVIVTYKTARLTIDALRSVAAERGLGGPRIRAVVVDNASGDAPAIVEAVRSHGWDEWVEVFVAPRNGGFSYGNNVGIERAYASRRPDYVYLMNPDAVVRPHAIATLVEFLESHPEVGIAGSSFEDLDGSDWPIAFRFPGLLSELSSGVQLGLISRMLERWETARIMTKTDQPADWICGASMMIRPAVFDAIAGFDENYFLYFEETDFCYRARRAGYPTWYVPESRVMHIRGASTTVTDRIEVPQRLPAYWFDSRRRYFQVTYGTGRAILIDLVAVAAHSLGWLKRRLLGRTQESAPHLIRDLITHSSLWPKNQRCPPFRCSVRLACDGRE